MTSQNHSSIKRADLPSGHYKAEFFLFLMTILWGSTFAVVKVLLDELDYSQVLAYRFSIATFVLLGFCWVRKSWPNRKEWWGGFVLGIFLFIVYLTQTIGLKSTTASKSGFITSMLVVWVPVFSVIFEKKFPRISSIAGVLIVITGLVLLIHPQGTGVNRGDVWTLASALFCALYIVQLQIESKRSSRFPLLVVQMVTMTLGCILALGIEQLFFSSSSHAWIPSLSGIGWILYLSLGCTLLTIGGLTYFQRGTTATRAALIYTAEPVFAAGIAYCCLSERLSLVQSLGALIILGGVLFSEFYPDSKRMNTGENSKAT